jgi:predicted nucleotidyltransferase
VSLYTDLFSHLIDSGVRFVVVGGVAVVLQGVARLTADIDLVIDLEPGNARRAIETLQSRGLRPLAPVNALDFADAAKRQNWIDTKNLDVFSMRDLRNPLITVDLFAKSPFPFDELWSRADIIDVGGRDVRIASIPDLIAMKRASDRAQDRIDVERLQKLRQEKRR